MGFVKKNLSTLLGVLVAGIGILISINDKKEQEEKIAEAVNKAVSERLN